MTGSDPGLIEQTVLSCFTRFLTHALRNEERADLLDEQLKAGLDRLGVQLA